MSIPLGIFGYPDHSGTGNLNLDNLIAGGGIYIFSDGSTLTFTSSGPFLTFDSAPEIIDSRVLVAGDNIILDRTTPGQLTIVAQATGGSGASTSASYVTINTEPSLSNERRLAEGNGITLVDNGPNSTVDVGISSSLLNASFLTVGPETLLTGERRLIAQGGLELYDNGANNSLVITASGVSAVTGSQTFTTGSYSLDNTSYTVSYGDTSGGNITFNLPAANTVVNKLFVFKKDGAAGTITLDANGVETIDGQGTYTMAIPYQAVNLMSLGSFWILW